MPPRTPIRVSPPADEFQRRLHTALNTAANTGTPASDPAALHRIEGELRDAARRMDIVDRARTRGPITDARRELALPAVTQPDERTSLPRADVVAALQVLGLDAARVNEVNLSPYHVLITELSDRAAGFRSRRLSIDAPEPAPTLPTIAEPGAAPTHSEEF